MRQAPTIIAAPAHPTLAEITALWLLARYVAPTAVIVETDPAAPEASLLAQAAYVVGLGSEVDATRGRFGRDASPGIAGRVWQIARGVFPETEALAPLIALIDGAERGEMRAAWSRRLGLHAIDQGLQQAGTLTSQMRMETMWMLLDAIAASLYAEAIARANLAGRIAWISSDRRVVVLHRAAPPHVAMALEHGALLAVFAGDDAVGVARRPQARGLDLAAMIAAIAAEAIAWHADDLAAEVSTWTWTPDRTMLGRGAGAIPEGLLETIAARLHRDLARWERRPAGMAGAGTARRSAEKAPSLHMSPSDSPS